MDGLMRGLRVLGKSGRIVARQPNLIGHLLLMPVLAFAGLRLAMVPLIVVSDFGTIVNVAIGVWVAAVVLLTVWALVTIYGAIVIAADAGLRGERASVIAAIPEMRGRVAPVALWLVVTTFVVSVVNSIEPGGVLPLLFVFLFAAATFVVLPSLLFDRARGTWGRGLRLSMRSFGDALIVIVGLWLLTVLLGLVAPVLTFVMLPITIVWQAVAQVVLYRSVPVMAPDAAGVAPAPGI
jgi:hypothetical protein